MGWSGHSRMQNLSCSQHLGALADFFEERQWVDQDAIGQSFEMIRRVIDAGQEEQVIDQCGHRIHLMGHQMMDILRLGFVTVEAGRLLHLQAIAQHRQG